MEDAQESKYTKLHVMSHKPQTNCIPDESFSSIFSGIFNVINWTISVALKIKSEEINEECAASFTKFL